MQNLTAQQWLVLLSVLAGAIHVLSLDHWVPASVLVWQKRWRTLTSAAFATGLFVLHLLLGFAIYFILSDFFKRLEPMKPEYLGYSAIGFVAICAGVRTFRFPRIYEVLRAGPNSAWGIFAAISLLGPCESLVPILVKAHQLGTGYLIPFCAFLAGTLISGIALVLAGRVAWHKPFLLSRSIRLAHRRITIVPVAAGLMIGLGFLFSLT